VSLAYASEYSFSDKISDLLRRVDYRLAVSDQEREDIFRLRYEAYMRENSISPNYRKLFSDSYDESDNCWVFGVHVDGELAASVRIHLATTPQSDCPSLKTFPDYLGPALGSGKTIVDSTRFVVDRDAARRFSGIPYATLRLCWMAVEHFRATHFLAAIRSEHQAFYKRTFQHHPVCPPRAYEMLNCPISLMSVSYEEAAGWVYERYPFFRSNFFERRMLFDVGRDIHLAQLQSTTADPGFGQNARGMQ
jgi:N-acyl-L-homoserine lactone synthetase